jgi:O-antigen ligase
VLAISDRIRKPNAYIVTCVLFLLWTALSILWSHSPAMTFSMIKTYTQLVLMALIVWNIYTSRWMVNYALWAYLLGAYISAIIVVRNFVAGAVFMEGLTVARYTAAGQDPNDLGVLLSIGVPIAIWLGGTQKLNGFIRILVYSFIPMAIFSILLTASRTALIALAVGLFFAIVMPSKLKFRTRAIVLVLLIVGLFYVQSLVPGKTLERLGQIGSSISSGDLEGRGAIWSQGISLFVANPILGVGSGAFASAIDLQRVAHNVVISIAAETGIIGLALFGTMFLLVILAAFRHPSPDRYLWLTIIACWTIGSLTLNWEFRKQTWMLFALIVSSADSPPQSNQPKRIFLFHSTNPIKMIHP